MSANLEAVRKFILAQLADGNINSELYTKMLIDAGLTEEQADKELDKLIEESLEDRP